MIADLGLSSHEILFEQTRGWSKTFLVRICYDVPESFLSKPTVCEWAALDEFSRTGVRIDSNVIWETFAWCVTRDQCAANGGVIYPWPGKVQRLLQGPNARKKPCGWYPEDLFRDQRPSVQQFSPKIGSCCGTDVDVALPDGCIDGVPGAQICAEMGGRSAGVGGFSCERCEDRPECPSACCIRLPEPACVTLPREECIEIGGQPSSVDNCVTACGVGCCCLCDGSGGDLSNQADCELQAGQWHRGVLCRDVGCLAPDSCYVAEYEPAIGDDGDVRMQSASLERLEDLGQSEVAQECFYYGGDLLIEEGDVFAEICNLANAKPDADEREQLTARRCAASLTDAGNLQWLCDYIAPCNADLDALRPG